MVMDVSDRVGSGGARRTGPSRAARCFPGRPAAGPEAAAAAWYFVYPGVSLQTLTSAWKPKWLFSAMVVFEILSKQQKTIWDHAETNHFGTGLEVTGRPPGLHRPARARAALGAGTAPPSPVPKWSFSVWFHNHG